MSKMKAVQVEAAGGPLKLVELDVPQPADGQVRIRVQACGICHSDSLVKEGIFPGIEYPRVPGHEVIGVIDAVGRNVGDWKPGQRVGEPTGQTEQVVKGQQVASSARKLAFVAVLTMVAHYGVLDQALAR